MLKGILTCVLLGGMVIANVSRERKTLPPSNQSSTLNPSQPVSFEANVLPILKNNCNPCHFPGGKMYDRLPFDKATTIINHSEGVLKRIKKEEDANMIRMFVSENPNVPN